MNTNQIIDEDLTHHQSLTPKAFGLMKVSGLIAIILAIVSMVQILIGLGSMTQQMISLFPITDMDGGYKFYIFSGILNRLVNMLLNLFAVVFLFRYSMYAMKEHKNSFGNTEWDAIFKSMRNLFIVFGLMNVSWFLFSMLNVFISFII